MNGDDVPASVAGISNIDLRVYLFMRVRIEGHITE